jgi:hypothetical protein
MSLLLCLITAAPGPGLSPIRPRKPDRSLSLSVEPNGHRRSAHTLSGQRVRAGYLLMSNRRKVAAPRGRIRDSPVAPAIGEVGGDWNNAAMAEPGQGQFSVDHARVEWMMNAAQKRVATPLPISDRDIRSGARAVAQVVFAVVIRLRTTRILRKVGEPVPLVVDVVRAVRLAEVAARNAVPHSCAR